MSKKASGNPTGSKTAVERPSSTKVASNNVSVSSISLNDIAQILTNENTDDSSPISYFVMDEKERIQAFLRNRDANYINIMNVSELKPDRIRMAILGALRFNKQLVFDLIDNELLIDSLQKICAEIEPSLFQDLFNGQIRNEEKYTKLIKDSDGELYRPHFFAKENMTYFKVILFLSKPTDNDFLLKLAKPYKVVHKQ